MQNEKTDSLYLNLIKAWRIIKWLDDARWHKGTSSSLIPGPIFASLDPSDQILTHWLCYITDQQRPWQDVWMRGGPIFSEIVKHYKGTSSTEDMLGILSTFSHAKGPGKVDVLTSKQQTINGQRITYTPRYGSHILSISRTLFTLQNFQNNIISYLSNNSSFIFHNSQEEDDSPTLRMAFLLYLLSYNEIYTGITSFFRQRTEIKKDLVERQKKLEYLFKAKEELENIYLRWIKYRFYKRLWAGFRDYVKQGSYFEAKLLLALDDVKAEAILSYLQQNRKKMLCSLELPGDTWNLKFNQKLFDNKINSPSELRQFYNWLLAKGHLSDEFYPEQFDVSFDYAPRMCDLGNEALCPFKKGIKLYEYCLGSSGKGKLCPVTRILADYESDCLPEKCPIILEEMEDICSGCGWSIV